MKYKYFALDIDGTIFSSEEIIYPVYKEAIELFAAAQNSSLRSPPRERIMLEIGKPVKVIFQNLFPELSENDRDKISDSILGLLCKRIDAGGGEYYANVAQTIESLVASGAQILVASNGRRSYVEAILRHLDVLRHIVHATYIEAEIHSKNDIMRSYVERGLAVREILMVGDRLSDYDAAKTIGADFAWCAYGHAPAGEISDYTIRLEKFNDLLHHV